MLERASGCLKPGGGRLLKHANSRTKSRRLLHSAFWCHGAGEINLPDWWISLLQRPPPEQSSETQSIVDTAKSYLSAGLADGGFLEFLYPAKTLTLIHKLAIRDASHHLQRSRAKHHHAPQSSRNYTNGASSEGRIALESDRHHASDLIHAMREHDGEIIHNRRTLSDKARLRQPISQRVALDTDLDDEGYVRHTAAIRKIDSAYLRTYEQDTESRVDDSEEQGNIIETSEQIVDGAKEDSASEAGAWEAEDYERAIIRAVEEDGGGTDEALRLYSQALTESKDDSSTPTILRLAIEDEKWTMGAQAMASFLAAGRDESGFWAGLSVFSMPQIARKALKSYEALRASMRRGEEEEPALQSRLREFTIKLIENVFSREAISDTKKVPTALHYKLFVALKVLTKHPSGHHYHLAIRQVLSTFTGEGDKAKFMDYGDHAIRLYRLMRKREDLVPEDDMLRKLLRRASQTHHYMAQVIYKDLISLYGAQVKKEPYWYILNEMLNQRNLKAAYGVLEDMKKAHGTDWETSALYIRLLLGAHSHIGELPQAIRLFESLEAKANETPVLEDWNRLVGAYCRAGDLEGAKECLAQMRKDGIQPDIYTYQPLMAYHANRGDIQALIGANSDLVKADEPAHPVYWGCLIEAHVQAKQFKEAKSLLYAAVDKGLAGTSTKMWNPLLSAYAARGMFVEFNEVRQRMISADVAADARTVAAHAQALCSRGYVENAWVMIKNLPAHKGMRPVSKHFLVVMEGFLRKKEYGMVFSVYNWMLDHGVSADIKVKGLMIKAAAKLDQLVKKDSEASQLLLPRAEGLLEEVIESLEPIGMSDEEENSSNSGNVDAFESLQGRKDHHMIFEYLIAMYGKMEVFEKTQQLYDRYISLHTPEPSESSESSPGRAAADLPPLKMLSALMVNYKNNKQYDQVERCWQLALSKSTALACPEGGADTSKPGWVMPSRRYILSRPLFAYLRSLAEEGRLADMDKLFRHLLRQGWGIKSQAWNLYVQAFALSTSSSSPSSSSSHSSDRLRAFRVAETQLFTEWPGWPPSQYRGQRLAFVRNLNKLQPSPVESERRMPEYKTLVLLAAALREMKREALFSRMAAERLEDVRGLAPKAVAAVEAFPSFITDGKGGGGDALARKYLGDGR